MDERTVKRVALSALASSLFMFAAQVRAWDAFGHLVVADLAWQALKPATRDKVAALLTRNPDYDQWVKNVPAAKRDEYAFMRASTWPDDIKRDDVRFTDEGDSATGPKAARNVGYSDVLRHRYWHYIDFPFSPDGTPLADAGPVNIQTQIHAFRQTLKSAGASERLKSYDLVWLIHLVGDAHQPLHSTSRFTQALPHGDRGGGLVNVCPAACETKNPSLHAFWDDLLGTTDDRAQAHAVATSLGPANPAAVAVDDEHVWLEESFALAKSDVYVAPIGTGSGPFALTSTYQTKARAIAQDRVALAGARLARVIEESF